MPEQRNTQGTNRRNSTRSTASKQTVRNSEPLHKTTARRANAARTSKKRSSGKPDWGVVFLLFVIAGLVVLLITKLTGPSTVRQVAVKLSREAAQAASVKGFTDDDFIRQSGAINRKMSEISVWEKEAGDSIARMPGFVLQGIVKTSSSSVQLQIDARTPIAVLSTGSGYISIDADKYIIEKKTSYADGESILIDGISLRNPTVGQLAVDVSTDDRLENALYVVKVLRDNNIIGYFTNIHMLGDQEVRLVSTYDIPVIINMWFKETFSSDLVATVRVLSEKGAQNLTGWIYAVNGNIAWHEDADYFSPIKGK